MFLTVGNEFQLGKWVKIANDGSPCRYSHCVECSSCVRSEHRNTWACSYSIGMNQCYYTENAGTVKKLLFFAVTIGFTRETLPLDCTKQTG